MNEQHDMMAQLASRMYAECIVRPENGPDHARRRATLPEYMAEVGRIAVCIYSDAPDERNSYVVVQVTDARFDSAERTRRQILAHQSGTDHWIVRPSDPAPNA